MLEVETNDLQFVNLQQYSGYAFGNIYVIKGLTNEEQNQTNMLPGFGTSTGISFGHLKEDSLEA